MKLKDFIFSVYAEWAKDVGQGQKVLDSFILATYGPRLFIHDFSHIVSGTGFYLRGEEASGIVQSVLTRESSVSSSRDKPYSELDRDIPPLSEFDDEFFAKLKKHSNKSWLTLHPGESLPQTQHEILSPERIKHYYALAVEFDRLFAKKFKQHFYTVDTNELCHYDAGEVISLVKQAWKNVGHKPTHRLASLMLEQYEKHLVAPSETSAYWRQFENKRSHGESSTNRTVV